MKTRSIAGAAVIASFVILGCAGHTGRAARDCDACPTMQTIPAGPAVFGSNATAAFAQPDELPRREVRVQHAFAVSKYEVTRAQYDAFVRATHRDVGTHCLTDRTRRGNWVYDDHTTYLDPGFQQGNDHPAACVSFEDAQAYVAWLNTQTNGGYRLLTEVEWEYVAAAGARTLFPWSDEPKDACRFANGFDQTTWAVYLGMDITGYKVFDPLPCSDGWLNTNPVGSLAPNAFGVYDMIGNVSEWVADCYAPTHTIADPAAAPPATCAKRIAKGGSWGTLAHNLRTAERFPYAPTHRDDSIGIRVARPAQ